MGDSRRIAKPGIRSEGGELSRKVEKVLFQEDDDGRWCEEIENSDWQKSWILKKEQLCVYSNFESIFIQKKPKKSFMGRQYDKSQKWFDGCDDN